MAVDFFVTEARKLATHIFSSLFFCWWPSKECGRKSNCDRCSRPSLEIGVDWWKSRTRLSNSPPERSKMSGDGVDDDSAGWRRFFFFFFLFIFFFWRQRRRWWSPSFAIPLQVEDVSRRNRNRKMFSLEPSWWSNEMKAQPNQLIWNQFNQTAIIKYISTF